MSSKEPDPKGEELKPNDGKQDAKGKKPNGKEDGAKKRPQPTYYRAPKDLPGFPDAKLAPRKGPRKRWKDSKKKKIYEWDSRHGRLEGWDWKGKTHQGEFDPDTGKMISPPDPSKQPITPTYEMPMYTTSEVGYEICWFSPRDEGLLGRQDLPNVTPDMIREWFWLGENDPPIEGYRVTASQRRHLEEHVEQAIDLNSFDYFVESFAADR